MSLPIWNGMHRGVLAGLAPVVALTFVAVAQQPPSLQEREPQQAAAPRTISAPVPQTGPARAPDEQQADLYMARKQYSEATAVYLKLLAKDPKNASLLNKTGIAYLQQARLEMAKRYFERATKADRKFANAFNNLGTVYYERKDYTRAVKNYKKAIERNPQLPAVHSNLGFAYFALRKYEEAMESFRHALELDPEVFSQTNASGSLLQDRSVGDKGLFYFLMAKSYARVRNVERCAQYLRKARDEKYAGLDSAKTDPAFAAVMQDPVIMEILQIPPPAKPNTGPPGA